jgi:fatty acid hydroxylase family protein
VEQEIIALLSVAPLRWLITLILWLAIWAPLVAVLEYGVHRWIMHKGNHLLDPTLDHLKSHGAHHKGANEGEFVDAPLKDCLSLTSPVFILLTLWGLAVGPFSAVVIPAAALLAWSFLYAYLWTRVHRAIHGIEANWFQRTGPVFQFFRDHHFKHHGNAKVNYGAVFPWTDYLFLTWRGSKAARAAHPTSRRVRSRTN